MKILITGGTGFIGSHCADAFINRGHYVTTFDCKEAVHEFRAQHIVGDLRDADAVDVAVKDSDFVIHAGGTLGTHETVLAAYNTSANNILGGLNVLDAVRRHDRKLINISKPNVWLNPYSITKDCMEKFCFMYVSEFDAQIAIVKLFNVYGPRQKYSEVQKAIPTWIVHAFWQRPLDIFGTGLSTMDLIHTRDVVDAIIGIVDHFSACRIKRVPETARNVWSDFQAYNTQVLELGSGHEISVNDVVRELSNALGFPVDVRHLPMRRGEVDGSRLCADISLLSKVTGFEPKVLLQDGLRETIAYYKENLSLIGRGKL